MKEFAHKSLEITDDKPLVYTAMSKHYFYFRMHISKFVIEKGGVPLNPFMITEYFLIDTVDRNDVRSVNNNLVRKSEEIWVFGPVSDGVLAEVKIAKEMGKLVKYFKIVKSKEIVPIPKDEVEMEDDVKEFRNEL
ncbi:MAG: hypothetical protein JW716_05705 [Candidatus Aenigmarchaeota archaeon]|nr:hypothetical protein [Candidatus Aenigmarchaeota archaeon]